MCCAKKSEHRPDCGKWDSFIQPVYICRGVLGTILELSWRPKGLRVLREEPVQARGVPARAREEVWARWPALAPRGPPLQREQVEEQPGLRRIEAAAWLGLGSGLGSGFRVSVQG